MLVAKNFGGKTSSGHSKWICACDCGKEVIVQASNLKSGNSKSCGCVSNETHGMSSSGAYKSWQAMLARCYSPKHPKFKNYGGAGILVCEYIRTSPVNLVDLIGDRPAGKTLDRINNKFGYNCGKCADCLRLGLELNIKWSSPIEQNQNRKTVLNITANGETHCVAEWARITGLSEGALRHRLKGRNKTPLFQPSSRKK